MEILEFGDLDFLRSQLVLVLRLLVLNLDFLLDEFVSFGNDLVTLFLCFLLSALVSVLHVLDLLREILILQFFLRQSLLSFAERLLLLAEFSTDLSSEIDVTHPLLHHEIDRGDRLLDVFWLCAEEVTNRWNSIALLSLSDVLQVVHEVGFL